MPTITGTEGNDVLTGTADADVITGLGGDDTITAGLGDSVDGGDGTDSLTLDLRGALNGAEIFGSAYATASGLTLFGGVIANVEIISTLYLPDAVNQIFLIDPVLGGSTIFGGNDFDMIGTSSGNDVIHGGDGNDSIGSGAGDDQVFGDAGNDGLSGGSGHNLIDGGAGLDSVSYGGAVHGVTVDLSAGTASDAIEIFDTLISIEAVSGSEHDDSVTGSIGDDTLIGSLGNDTLSGGLGNDIVDGEWGADVVNGGGGDDTLYSGDVWWSGRAAEHDVLDGGDGNDQLNFGIGDDVTGGLGNDIAGLSLTGTGHGESVNIAAMLSGAPGANGGGTVTGVESFNVVFGGSGDDVIDLGGATLVSVGSFTGGIYAGNGNDTVIGGPGSDNINGGNGDDRLYGGGGNDYYTVDSQADLIFENPGEGTDSVSASGSFYLYANVENLALTASAGNAFAVGNDLDNRIDGNASANLLLGGAGNDLIWTGGGNDVVYGEDGNDALNGWDGTDYLIGGTGNDSLNGANNTDALYGEDGNDQLYGGQDFATDIMVGGAGDDILFANSALGDYDILNGGAGNDLYYVDTPADIIYEAAGEGRDTVIADIRGAGYYLWAEVEDCTLVGDTPFAAGNDLDNLLIGSDQANWLLGNGGSDTLNGKGGNDVLFGDLPGGHGIDTFAFQANCGQDVIGDFHHGEDKMLLIGFYADFAQASSHFVQNGSDGAIDLGGGNIVILAGVDMNTLTATDFIFN